MVREAVRVIIIVSKVNLKVSRLRIAIAACMVLCMCVSPQSARADGARQVVGTDRVHVVQLGENLYSIAKSYGLAIEHLAFANNLSPDSISVAAGTELMVPNRRVLPANPPSSGLVVNLPERGVYLFRAGSFVKFYPIAIGQPGRFATPQGNFTIANKTVDPVWLPPEWANMGEEPVPAGPNNPLGDRWIGLSTPGIGLHSTTSPMSIGQAVSHGCMRMYPASVHELYDRVQVGWPVRIEYETAKVGYDEEKGVYCLVTFPDVYGISSPYKAAEKALLDNGFGVDMEDLRNSVYKDGMAMDLTTANPNIPVTILVNDEEVQWPEQPVLMEGTLIVPAKVASALGMALEWDNDRQLVKVTYGNTSLYFPVNESFDMSKEIIPAGKNAEQGGTAVKFGSTAMIPLRPILNAYNVPHVWDSASKTMRLTRLK